MVAFAFVVAEPLQEMSAVGMAVMGVAMLLYVLGRIVRFGVLLAQSMRAVESDYEITIQHGSRVWRKVLIAAFVAVLGAATLSAFPVDCNSIPWWTIEYWYYCSGK